MKVNNFIVTVLLVVVALVLSGLYRMLGLEAADHGFDYGLAAIWLVVIAVGVVVITQREHVRRELIRRIYLADGQVFSAIDGLRELSVVAPGGSPDALASYAAATLSRAQYGYDLQEPPEDFRAKRVIRSAKFKAAADGSGAAQDAQWSGDVCRVLSQAEAGAAGRRGHDAELEPIATFTGAAELATALAQ